MSDYYREKYYELEERFCRRGNELEKLRQESARWRQVVGKLVRQLEIAKGSWVGDDTLDYNDNNESMTEARKMLDGEGR